jgi:hypothetical protein
VTTYADPVFPLPEPEFLWVYDLLVHPASASVTVGAGRRWRYQEVTPVGFVGYIGAPNPREVERAARRDVRIDAVALAPHGTAVSSEDQLEAAAGVGSTGAEVPAVFVGRYAIEAVRPNASHVRILLTRIDGEDPPHAP